MSSATAPCAQCLRTLRRGLRAEKIMSLPECRQQIRFNPRPFSTRSVACQQAPSPNQHSTSRQPNMLPTTAGTVTSNITADAPLTPSPFSPSRETSVAEMQRTISTKLSASRTSELGRNLALKLRSSAKGTTDTYIAYGITQNMFKSCSAQAAYTIPEGQRTAILTGKGPPKTAGGEDLGIPDTTTDNADASTWWFNDLGLQPTFSTWSQVTYLHMYLLTVRLRALPTQATFLNYQRYLIEHFSHGAEEKMLILHSMAARGIRNRYLKDLFLQWRGVLAAYDEGLIKGDAVLAAAVWRNLFKADPDVDWEKVSLVVAYVRKVAGMLARVEIDEIVPSIQGSDGIFQAARSLDADLAGLVGKNSAGINQAADIDNDIDAGEDALRIKS